MPLVHPSSLLTKTNKPRRHRGNISILSVVWLGFTATASLVIVHAMSVVQQRARIQASADAVVLAYASRNELAARTMARHLHVTIVNIAEQQNVVTITIQSSAETAVAQALRSQYEFEP